jgi:hypothetical protein
VTAAAQPRQATTNPSAACHQLESSRTDEDSRHNRRLAQVNRPPEPKHLRHPDCQLAGCSEAYQAAWAAAAYRTPHGKPIELRAEDFQAQSK